MLFVLSKVLWPILNPASLLLWLLLAAAVLVWTRRRRLARAVVTLAALFALVLTLGAPVSRAFLASLEDRFPPPANLPERVDGIIVLGGAVNPALSASRGQTSIGAAAERLFGFAALAKRYPDAALVYSGGTGALRSQDLKEADFTRPVIAALGLDPDRVTYERESRDTYENAVMSLNLVRPGPDEVWILVTSAAHMPRAIGCFRNVGWDVVPFPVDYRTTGEPRLRPGYDLLGGVDVASHALHEFLGLVVYWMTGRTDAPIPAPR